MSARRLPRLGGRVLRALAQEGGPALERGAGAQAASRALHTLAGRPDGRASAAALLGGGAGGPLRPAAASSLHQRRGFADLPAHEELAMPSLSPTMTQGNILAWRKKEGDAVQPGDVLCEVETDKATIEWEAQEEGFLARILMPEGSKDVAVGTPVAVLVADEGDLAAFKDYQPGAAAAPKAAPAAAEEKPAAAAAAGGGGSFPAHNVLAMPALSPTMTQGNILSWRKKEGDEVAAGDVFAEVETDKATIEWESQEDGVLAKILVPEGSKEVAVGTPVMVLVEDKSEVPAFASFTAADVGGAPKKAAAAEAAAPAAAPATPAAPAAAPARKAAPASAFVQPAGGRIVASPYAKKLAADAGISLAGVPGSGPGGRIVAEDVQRLIASGGARPAAAAAAPGVPAAAAGAAPAAAEYTDYYTDIPTSQIKRVTARRLLESKQQIPHYYLTASIRVDALSKLRAQLNENLAAADGGKLSLNDFVIKAASLSLKKVPQVNASWHGDFIRQYNVVDCSVAVQTPIGLMVPIVRDADQKGLAQIAAEVKALAAKAKDGKLQPEEFTGGTFTISNLGMYGVTQFAAIVNPPQACIPAVGATEKRVEPPDLFELIGRACTLLQACILAVGATEKRVVSGAAGFEEGSFMQVTLSCDHRVVDGAVGAQWLQAFRAYLENPATMLL